VSQWLGARDDEVAAEARPRPANGSANGADAAPVHRLTSVQREQLALQLQLDPRAVRNGAGVSAEVAEMAVSGVALASEIVDRLTRYLEA
jgi:hypothetical protein